jgi:hypothetical protein
MWGKNKDMLEYNDCVIDCYIDSNKDVEIIEVNSGGAFLLLVLLYLHWKKYKMVDAN